MMEGLPGIHLRAIEPEDLDTLYNIENDRVLWDVGVTNVPYSRYILHNYVANTAGDIYSDKQVRLMIEDDSKQVVGIIDMTDFSPRHQRAEIGIVLTKEHRKKGYARAALQELIEYSHKFLHLHQLYAYVDSSNKNAIDLFCGMGFNQQNTIKDWLFDGDDYHDAILMQLFL